MRTYAHREWFVMMGMYMSLKLHLFSKIVSDGKAKIDENGGMRRPAAYGIVAFHLISQTIQGQPRNLHLD